MSLLVSAKKSGFGKPLRQGKRPIPSELERSEATPLPVAEPELNDEMTRRFNLLVERLTDVLMRDREVDREACRADAITMMIAAGQKLAAATSEVSSVVVGMLQAEQKVREVAPCPPEPAGGPGSIFTFMKA